MKTFTSVMLIAAALFTAPAFASTHKEAPEMQAAAQCEAKAVEKKLAGAAKTSFLKKCNREAPKTECELKAAEKKLAGAAKTSYVKKCSADAADMAASAASAVK